MIASVLGHEAVVEVVAHRRSESDLSVGDRLTFSVADSCGKCEFCLRGLNQKCVKLFKVWKENNNNLTSFTNIYIYSSIYSMVMLN